MLLRGRGRGGGRDDAHAAGIGTDDARVSDRVVIVSVAVSVVDDELAAVHAGLVEGGQLLEQENWGKREEGLDRRGGTEKKTKEGEQINIEAFHTWYAGITAVWVVALKTKNKRAYGKESCVSALRSPNEHK